jgi:hypothetical protein
MTSDLHRPARNKENSGAQDRDLECIISRVKDVKMEMPASKRVVCLTLRQHVIHRLGSLLLEISCRRWMDLRPIEDG